MNHQAKQLDVIPFVAKPVGWMKCIACSDFRQRPGQMWLGYTMSGQDIFVTCPACKGAGQVERLKHIDVRTGREIDYEKPGQRFVQLSHAPASLST